MDTPVWLVESPVHLDHHTPTIIDFILPVPTHHTPLQLDESLSSFSNVYHFNYAPNSFIHWRVTQDRKILELRRVFLASSTTAGHQILNLLIVLFIFIYLILVYLGLVFLRMQKLDSFIFFWLPHLGFFIGLFFQCLICFIQISLLTWLIIIN